VLHGPPLTYCLTLTPHLNLTPIKKDYNLGGSIGHLIIRVIFIKYVLLKDVHHVDLFPQLGDVHVGFGILIYCFVQQLSYLLCCTPTFSTFIKSLVPFYSSFFQSFGHFLCPGSFDNLEIPLVCKYAYFPITLGGIKLRSITTIVAKLI